jgi:hypothetical protein
VANSYSSGDVTLEQLVEEHDALMYGPHPASSPHLSLASRGARPPQASFHHATPHYVHPPSLRIKFHHTLRKLANVTIINSSRTLEDLRSTLDELDLTNGERLRPRWDTYFMVRFLPFIHSTPSLDFVCCHPQCTSAPSSHISCFMPCFLRSAIQFRYIHASPTKLNISYHTCADPLVTT